ncbi:hypothetical protein KEG38_20575 [Polyangium jinanense]|uniref:KAP family P-loop NTPase fold protein n=1 Tax=Polyangium jinanense TaxID=2829994 RepID=UPI0023416E5B|nr:P-loop NTPase fold protein [Polyangium jinanense]MDC3956268.1 hypothetical protein [Polyangium jinanense]
MWSDNESDIDLLGYSHLVGAVTSIIYDEKLLPATIGVFGDWGSGKSSLLKMVELDLCNNKNVLVLTFNGWLFEGYEDAKTALMGTILDELAARQDLTDKAKTILGRLYKRINWMRVLGLAAKGLFAYASGGLAGLGLAGGAAAATHAAGTAAESTGGAGATPAMAPKGLDFEAAGKLLNDESSQDARRGIREFRADFGKLLAEAKVETLVVMIDDLDRCMPETIVETLEAIKLFLFVPQTAFIIGADERLVKYAVRRRFPELPGERAEVGRDYLEKLIQFPIRVPQLGRPEMETYINLLFARNGDLEEGQFTAIRKAAVVENGAHTLLEVRFNHGIAQKVLGKVPDKLAENLALAEQIAPVLAAGLNGNPRQCKRFLNTLVMRLEMARARNVQLQKRVLAKLMLLEYLKPESFKKLAEAQAEQGGKPTELAAEEKSRSPEKPKPSSVQPSSSEGDVKRAPPRPAPARKSTDEDDAGQASPAPIWLSDSWITTVWLRLEPKLAQEDLRPYFFFSRDILGSLGGSVQRLSPRAQEAILGLFEKSEAARRNTLNKAKDLSDADAAAVLEALAERVRQEEDLGHAASAFSRMCDWVATRAELFGQFITFLSSVPDTGVPVSAVTAVESLAGDNQERRNQAKQLLSQWSHGGNIILKNAASARLKKLS